MPATDTTPSQTKRAAWIASISAALRDADWINPERVRRIAIVYSIFLVAALAFEVWIHIHPQWLSAHPALKQETGGLPLGEDFINYWAGAQLATHGQAAQVYDLKDFVRYQRQHVAAYADFRWYSYPPVALVLTAPLALFPYLLGYVFWLAGGMLLCASLLARQLRWTEAILCAAAPPAYFNIVAGQNGQFTAGLLVGGIFLLERRPLLSGVLFGALCFKPQLGIVIPVALAAGGHWRTFVAASATVAALLGVSILAFGWDTWIAFFKVAHFNVFVMNQPIMWHRMPTVFAAARLAGAGISLAMLIQALSSLGAIAVTAVVWRRSADTAPKGAALIVATILATPYAWDYDLMAAVFAIVWLWQDGARRGYLGWEKLILAATMAVTLCAGQFANDTHIQIAPVALWAALMVAVRRATVGRAVQGIQELRPGDVVPGLLTMPS